MHRFSSRCARWRVLAAIPALLFHAANGRADSVSQPVPIPVQSESPAPSVDPPGDDAEPAPPPPAPPAAPDSPSAPEPSPAEPPRAAPSPSPAPTPADAPKRPSDAGFGDAPLPGNAPSANPNTRRNAPTGNAAFPSAPANSKTNGSSSRSKRPPRSDTSPAAVSAPQPATPSPVTHSTPAPAAPPVPPPEPEPEHDSSNGLFGPIRLGPLIGVGLPNLLNLGGTVKLTRFLGGGINIGIIPTAKLSYYGEATLSYQEYDIYGRLYPFGGGFFVGAGAGYAQVRGTLKGRIDLADYISGKTLIPAGLLPAGYQLPTAIDYESRGSVRTLVLTPQIGYFYTFGSGFSMGVDVGAQIPIAPSKIEFESTVSPPEVAELTPFKQQQQKVRDTLETVGRTPIPSMNFRIGWLL